MFITFSVEVKLCINFYTFLYRVCPHVMATGGNVQIYGQPMTDGAQGLGRGIVNLHCKKLPRYKKKKSFVLGRLSGTI
jgi:hypothetical protein